MQISIIRDAKELSELRDAWQDLPTRSPMNSLEWLLSWWEEFQQAKGVGPELTDQRCHLFCAAGWSSSQQLAGVAPWYLVQTSRGVRAIRNLGDGCVASDYLSILCRPGEETNFCQSLAQCLLDEWRDAWDLMDFDGTDALDSIMRDFAATIRDDGRCWVQAVPTTGTWQTQLPTTWDEYLSQLTKNHRKRVRRWIRNYVDTGRVHYEVFQGTERLHEFFSQLTRLNRLRRKSLGESGNFDDVRIANFHQSALQKLLASDQAHLSLLYLDGQPVAAEYVLKSKQDYFAYQSGFDPEAAQHSPGCISLALTIQYAIDQGIDGFDFLRGDEEYKRKWGAVHRPAVRLRVRQPSFSAVLGHVADSAKTILKSWGT